MDWLDNLDDRVSKLIEKWHDWKQRQERRREFQRRMVR